jgi:hypothetical protein
LAFGLAFVISASWMIRRRQNYGGTSNKGTRSGESLSFRPNLILQSDTVWCFSSEFLMIQADAKRCKTLIIKLGMTCEDS